MTWQTIPLSLATLALVGFAQSATAGNTSWDSNVDHWSHYKRIRAEAPPPSAREQAEEIDEFTKLTARYAEELEDILKMEPASGNDEKYYGKHENGGRYNN